MIVENPDLKDLYSIGTKALIKKMARKADGTLEVVLLGVERVVLLKLEPQGNYQTARVKPLPLVEERSPEVEALRREVSDLAGRALALIQPQAAEELRRLIAASKESIRLVYTLAPMFGLELKEEQALLEAPTLADSLRLMHAYLTREIQVLELRSKIANEAQSEMGKEQREYILRQQMRAIQKELDGENPEKSEIALLRERLAKTVLPEEVRKEAERELARLERLPPAAAGLSRHAHLSGISARVAVVQSHRSRHRYFPCAPSIGRGPLRPARSQRSHSRAPRRAKAQSHRQGADPLLRRPAGRRQDFARTVDRARPRPQVRAPEPRRPARRSGIARPPPYLHRRHAGAHHSSDSPRRRQ